MHEQKKCAMDVVGNFSPSAPNRLVREIDIPGSSFSLLSSGCLPGRELRERDCVCETKSESPDVRE